jgi:hypothetical protein
MVSEHEEDKEEKQVKPYRQRNENCVGKACCWEKGGEIRGRLLHSMIAEIAQRVTACQLLLSFRLQECGRRRWTSIPPRWNGRNVSDHRTERKWCIAFDVGGRALLCRYMFGSECGMHVITTHGWNQMALQGMVFIGCKLTQSSTVIYLGTALLRSGLNPGRRPYPSHDRRLSRAVF